jgi:hypothetical protein
MLCFVVVVSCLATCGPVGFFSPEGFASFVCVVIKNFIHLNKKRKRVMMFIGCFELF